jgi:hypothetical protein
MLNSLCPETGPNGLFLLENWFGIHLCVGFLAIFCTSKHGLDTALHVIATILCMKMLATQL